MALRLSQFDYRIEHRPEKSNIADYYSRNPEKAKPSAFLEELKTEQNINMISDCVIPASLTRAEIAEATAIDPEIQSLLKWMNLSTEEKRQSEITSGNKNVQDELNSSNDDILLRGQRIIIP